MRGNWATGFRPFHYRLRARSLAHRVQISKFYLASFRSYSDFHEECTIAIGKRIAAVLEPVYLRIGGYWSPRGGIPIDVFWETATLPANVWLPDQGIATYRGRG